MCLCGTKSRFITIESGLIYTCSVAPTSRLFSIGALHKIAKERYAVTLAYRLQSVAIDHVSQWYGALI